MNRKIEPLIIKNESENMKMIRFNDEIKALDFSINDIDKLIKALQEAKLALEKDDEWGYEITEISDKIIIQASDKEHIWIEPIENCY